MPITFNLTEDERRARELAERDFTLGVVHTEGPEADKSYATQSSYQLYSNYDSGVTNQQALFSAAGLGPQDSYTDYYNKTKKAPHGFEIASRMQLKREKVSQDYEKVLAGQMGYEDFLYQNYGKDIMKAEGHYLDSVNYWYNRLKQGYTDSPLDNTTYLQDVLDRSEKLFQLEEFYDQLVNKRYSHSLMGIVAGAEETAETIAQHFPHFQELADQLGGWEKLLKLYKAGMLQGHFDPTLDVNGDGKVDYYLHIDGKIYEVVSGVTPGPNQALATYNADGTLDRISVNGSDVTDVLHAFKAGLFDGLAGVLELPVFLGAGIVDFFENMFSDDPLFDFSDVSDFYTEWNAVKNSWGVFDEGVYDTSSGFKDAAGNVAWDNIFRGIGRTAGTITSMLALGVLGKAMSSAGQGLAQTGSIAGKAFGKTIGITGSVISKATGLFNGAPITGTVTRTLWQTTAESVAVLAVKDMQQTYLSLKAKQKLFNLSEGQIWSRTLFVTATNAAISMALRTGMDDKGALARLAQLGKKKVQVGKYLVSDLGKWILDHPIMAARISTLMDVTENFLTMAIQSHVASTGDYGINLNLITDPGVLFQLSMNAMMTYRGTRGAEGVRTGGILETFDGLSRVCDEFSLEMERMLSKAKNAEDVRLINEARQKFHEALKQPGDPITVRLNALEEAHKGLRTVLDKQDFGSSLVTKKLEKLMKESRFKAYTNEVAFVNEYYRQSIKSIKDLSMETVKKGWGAIWDKIKGSRKIRDIDKKLSELAKQHNMKEVLTYQKFLFATNESLANSFKTIGRLSEETLSKADTYLELKPVQDMKLTEDGKGFEITPETKRKLELYSKPLADAGLSEFNIQNGFFLQMKGVGGELQAQKDFKTYVDALDAICEFSKTESEIYGAPPVLVKVDDANKVYFVSGFDHVGTFSTFDQIYKVISAVHAFRYGNDSEKSAAISVLVDTFAGTIDVNDADAQLAVLNRLVERNLLDRVGVAKYIIQNKLEPQNSNISLGIVKYTEAYKNARELLDYVGRKLDAVAVSEIAKLMENIRQTGKLDDLVKDGIIDRNIFETNYEKFKNAASLKKVSPPEELESLLKSTVLSESNINTKSVEFVSRKLREDFGLTDEALDEYAHVKPINEIKKADDPALQPYLEIAKEVLKDHPEFQGNIKKGEFVIGKDLINEALTGGSKKKFKNAKAREAWESKVSKLRDVFKTAQAEIEARRLDALTKTYSFLFKDNPPKTLKEAVDIIKQDSVYALIKAADFARKVYYDDTVVIQGSDIVVIDLNEFRPKFIQRMEENLYNYLTTEAAIKTDNPQEQWDKVMGDITTNMAALQWKQAQQVYEIAYVSGTSLLVFNVNDPELDNLLKRFGYEGAVELRKSNKSDIPGIHYNRLSDRGFVFKIQKPIDPAPLTFEEVSELRLNPDYRTRVNDKYSFTYIDEDTLIYPSKLQATAINIDSDRVTMDDLVALFASATEIKAGKPAGDKTVSKYVAEGYLSLGVKGPKNRKLYNRLLFESVMNYLTELYKTNQAVKQTQITLSPTQVKRLESIGWDLKHVSDDTYIVRNFKFNGNYPSGKIRICDYIPEGEVRWFATKFSNLYLGDKTTELDNIMAYSNYTWLTNKILGTDKHKKFMKNPYKFFTQELDIGDFERTPISIDGPIIVKELLTKLESQPNNINAIMMVAVIKAGLKISEHIAQSGFNVDILKIMQTSRLRNIIIDGFNRNLTVDEIASQVNEAIKSMPKVNYKPVSIDYSDPLSISDPTYDGESVSASLIRDLNPVYTSFKEVTPEDIAEIKKSVESRFLQLSPEQAMLTVPSSESRVKAILRRGFVGESEDGAIYHIPVSDLYKLTNEDLEYLRQYISAEEYNILRRKLEIIDDAFPVKPIQPTSEKLAYSLGTEASVEVGSRFGLNPEKLLKYYQAADDNKKSNLTRKWLQGYKLKASNVMMQVGDKYAMQVGMNDFLNKKLVIPALIDHPGSLLVQNFQNINDLGGMITGIATLKDALQMGLIPGLELDDDNAYRLASDIYFYTTGMEYQRARPRALLVDTDGKVIKTVQYSEFRNQENLFSFFPALDETPNAKYIFWLDKNQIRDSAAPTIKYLELTPENLDKLNNIKWFSALAEAYNRGIGGSDVDKVHKVFNSGYTLADLRAHYIKVLKETLGPYFSDDKIYLLFQNLNDMQVGFADETLSATALNNTLKMMGVPEVQRRKINKFAKRFNDLLLYGLTWDALSSDEKAAVRKFEKDISSILTKEQKRAVQLYTDNKLDGIKRSGLPKELFVPAATSLMMAQDKAAILDYLINGKSLKDLNTLRETRTLPSITIKTASGEKAVPLNELFEGRPVYSIDTEALFYDSKLNKGNKPFSVSVVKLDADGNQTVTNILIDVGEIHPANPELAAYFKWVNQAESRKKAVDAYNNASPSERLSIEEARNLLSVIFENIEDDAIILTYNGREADIPWLKSNKLLSDKALRNIESRHIDGLRDIVQTYYRKMPTTMRKESLDKFREIYPDIANVADAHTAEADAIFTYEMIQQVISEIVDTNKMSTDIIRQIEEIAKDFGMTKEEAIEAIDEAFSSGHYKKLREELSDSLVNHKGHEQLTSSQLKTVTEIMRNMFYAAERPYKYKKWNDFKAQLKQGFEDYYNFLEYEQGSSKIASILGYLVSQNENLQSIGILTDRDTKGSFITFIKDIGNAIKDNFGETYKNKTGTSYSALSVKNLRKVLMDITSEPNLDIFFAVMANKMNNQNISKEGYEAYIQSRGGIDAVADEVRNLFRDIKEYDVTINGNRYSHKLYDEMSDYHTREEARGLFMTTKDLVNDLIVPLGLPRVFEQDLIHWMHTFFGVDANRPEGANFQYKTASMPSRLLQELLEMLRVKEPLVLKTPKLYNYVTPFMIGSKIRTYDGVVMPATSDMLIMNMHTFNMFYKGRSVEEVKADLNIGPNDDIYINVLRHPSNFKSVFPYRVIVNDDTSPTMQLMLSSDAFLRHAGDFDGDSITLLPVDAEGQKFYRQTFPFFYRGFSILDRLLRITNEYLPELETTNKYIENIKAVDEHLANRVAQDLDALIDGTKTYSELREDVYNEITGLIDSEFKDKIDDIIDACWITYTDLSLVDTRNPDAYQVTNNTVLVQNLDNIGIRNRETLKRIQTLKAFLLPSAVGKLDQTTGYQQKQLSMDLITARNIGPKDMAFHPMIFSKGTEYKLNKFIQLLGNQAYDIIKNEFVSMGVPENVVDAYLDSGNNYDAKNVLALLQMVETNSFLSDDFMKVFSVPTGENEYKEYFQRMYRLLDLYNSITEGVSSEPYFQHNNPLGEQELAHALLRHKINEFNTNNPHQKVIYDLDKRDIIPDAKILLLPSTFMPSDSFIVNDKHTSYLPIYSIVRYELNGNEHIIVDKPDFVEGQQLTENIYATFNGKVLYASPDELVVLKQSNISPTTKVTIPGTSSLKGPILGTFSNNSILSDVSDMNDYFMVAGIQDLNIDNRNKNPLGLDLSKLKKKKVTINGTEIDAFEYETDIAIADDISFNRQGLHDMKTDVLTFVFNQNAPEFVTVVGDLFFKVNPKTGQFDFDNSQMVDLTRRLKDLKSPDAMSVNAISLYYKLLLITLAVNAKDMPDDVKAQFIESVMINPLVSSEHAQQKFNYIVEKYYNGDLTELYNSLNKTQRRLFSQQLHDKFFNYYATTPQDADAIGPFSTKKGIKNIGMNVLVTQGRTRGKHLTDIATRNKLIENSNKVSVAAGYMPMLDFVNFLLGKRYPAISRSRAEKLTKMGILNTIKMVRGDYDTDFKPQNIYDLIHNNQYAVYNYTAANMKYGSGTVEYPVNVIYPVSSASASLLFPKELDNPDVLKRNVWFDKFALSEFNRNEDGYAPNPNIGIYGDRFLYEILGAIQPTEEERLLFLNPTTPVAVKLHESPYGFNITDQGIDIVLDAQRTYDNQTFAPPKVVPTTKMKQTIASDYYSAYDILYSPTREVTPYEGRSESYVEAKAKQLEALLQTLELDNFFIGDYSKDYTKLSKMYRNLLNGDPLDHELTAFESYIEDVEGTNIDHTFEKDWLDTTAGKFRTAKDAARYEAIMIWKRESRLLASQILSELPDLHRILKQTANLDEFNQYLFIRGSVEKANNEDNVQAEITMKATGMTLKEAEAFIENYHKRHPMLVSVLNHVINKVSDAAQAVSKLSGEPIPLYMIIAPLKRSQAEFKKGQVLWTLKSMVKNPNYADNLFTATNINFFEGITSLTEQIAKVMSAYNVSRRLKKGGELDNIRIRKAVNDVFNKFLDSAEIEETYSKFGIPYFNTIAELVLMEIPEFKLSKARGGAAYKEAYKQLRDLLVKKLERLQLSVDTTPEELNEAYAGVSDPSLKVVYEEALKIQDALLDIQEAILDKSPTLQEAVLRIVRQTVGSQYALTDRFGRIIPTEFRKDWSIAPLAEISTEFIKANLEYGINNEQAFQRTLAVKALNGELFLMNKNYAEHLNKHFYTTKIPGRVMKFLKDVSAWSTKLIMSSVAKLVNRVINFTLFDASITSMADPMMMFQLGRARKELSAMYQSRGKSLDFTPKLDESGKPIIDADGRPVLQNDLAEFLVTMGFDPLRARGYDWATFEHKVTGPKIVEKWFDTVSDVFTFQTLLVRYAYWLSIKKSFDEGNPKYGVAYANKDLVDALETNSKKAMYVVDQTLGAPGGFPYLANKLYGVAMFTTFPLALIRWGINGMRSLTRIINDALLGDTNWKGITRNLVIPALGTASLYAITHALIKFICELFDVDEETEEEWIKENVLIDPIATILNDAPVVAYGNSLNPIENLKEMFIYPFTKNESVKDKLTGFTSSLAISHLNPIIKVPIELMTQKDFYGPTVTDTSTRFNMVENAARKLAGYFIGASAANAFIENYRYGGMEGLSSMDRIAKAAGKAIAAEFGNSRAYKGEQRNYYKAMSIVNTYYFTEKAVAGKTSNSVSFSVSNNPYNEEHADELTSKIRRAMNNKASPAVIYEIIMEALQSGYTVSEVKAALRRCSIIGRLESIRDKVTFWNSLDEREKQIVSNAILYEQETYPILSDLLDQIRDAETSSKYSSGYNPYLRLPRVYMTDYDHIYPDSYTDFLYAKNKRRPYTNYNNSEYKQKEPIKNNYVPQFTEFTGKNAKNLGEVFNTNIRKEYIPSSKKTKVYRKVDDKAVMTTNSNFWRKKKR